MFGISNKVQIQRKELEATRSAKFEDKRFGPFLIHEKLDNGAYKLRTIEGKILQKYYNSDRLAKYYEPQAWEPVVVIESPGNFQKKFDLQGDGTHNLVHKTSKYIYTTTPFWNFSKNDHSYAATPNFASPPISFPDMETR